MKVRPGDAVFDRQGHPTLVKRRQELTGDLVLESDSNKVRQGLRHGYLNGISPVAREQLYDALDEVKEATQDPLQRTELLREKLVELRKDPRNHHLGQYLEAEIMHILNSFNIRPNEYTIHENKVR